MFSKGVSEFESQLLHNVRALFGSDIDILYLDMQGEVCDLRFANRVRIHLVQPKPTVH
jgi:microcystin degradation protein MlrC